MKNPKLWELGRFTIEDRRVLMTWVVGEAWNWLHTEKNKLIINSFCHVSISLTIDGSEDTQICVKGLNNLNHDIVYWTEGGLGGLDCNLDKFRKTGVGKLEWESEESELLNSIVAIEPGRELADMDGTGEEGEYVDIDEINVSY